MANYNEATLQRIADGARHESVTPENLVLDERSGIIFSKKWLSKPVISYLDLESEQPHVVLTSRDAVKINGKDAGESEYGAVLVITDERFLFLIGEENDDRVIPIPFRSDLKFEIEPSTTAQDQSLLNTDLSVTFWIRHKNGEIGITPDSELEYEDIVIISEVISDVSEDEIEWIGGQWWLNRIKSYQKIHELCKNAQSNTVTPSRLEPIFTHLHREEDPEFILTEGDFGVGIVEGSSDDSAVRWQQDTYFDWLAITSERVFIAADGDIEELTYDEIDSVAVSLLEQYDDHSNEYKDIPYLQVWVDDFVYMIEGEEFTDSDLRRATRYIRNQI